METETKNLQRYIKAGSDKEFHFIEEIANTPWLMDNVETAASNLKNAVRNAWERHSKTLATGNYNIWWNEDCQEAKDMLKMDPNQSNRNQYKSALKKAKNKFYQKHLKEMSRMQKPWEAVKWMRAHKPPPFSSIYNTQGHPLSSINELWEILHNQFNRVSVHQTDHTILNRVLAHPKWECSNFSEHEILKALATCLNSSADLTTSSGDTLSYSPNVKHS
ncbi:hypothetical protein AX17_005035 [Amanita inopinata Kibby_2008]|nr:hypothetical protein AX17_005035 [Amanita inopinata Kibby_2008]